MTPEPQRHDHSVLDADADAAPGRATGPSATARGHVAPVPAPAGGAAPVPAAPVRLRIGQVCELLRDEFPDVSISKLRFLEDRGLVTPLRTGSGYRMYTPGHVRELRQVLAMQRDEFLPLRVIRQELQRRLTTGPEVAAVDSATDAAVDAPAAGGLLGRAPAGPGATGVDDLARRSGAPVAVVEQAVAAGLVTGVRGDDGVARFGEDDVQVAVVVGQLAGLGFDVRQLRQALLAAGRQASVLEGFAGPRLRSGGARRAGAVPTVQHGADLLLRLVQACFTREVRASIERLAPGAGNVR